MPVTYINKDKDKSTRGELQDAGTASHYRDHDDANRVWTTTLCALLTLLLGRQGFITHFFLQFKESCVSELHPSTQKRCQLQKWLDQYSAYSWLPQQSLKRSQVNDFWLDGSLLCSLLNAAIPGACTNPQHHKRGRPFHGQNLAYKYLGVAPIFTEEDFSNHELSVKKHFLFLNYLNEIRKLVNKIQQQEDKAFYDFASEMTSIKEEKLRKFSLCFYGNTLINDSDLLLPNTDGNNTVYTVRVKELTKQHRLPYTSRAFFRSTSINLESKNKTNQCQIKAKTHPTAEKNRIHVARIQHTPEIYEASATTTETPSIESEFEINFCSSSPCSNGSSSKDAEVQICTIGSEDMKNGVELIVSNSIDKQIKLANLKLVATRGRTNNASKGSLKIQLGKEFHQQTSTMPILKEALDIQGSTANAQKLKEVSKMRISVDYKDFVAKSELNFIVISNCHNTNYIPFQNKIRSAAYPIDIITLQQRGCSKIVSVYPKHTYEQLIGEKLSLIRAHCAEQYKNMQVRFKNDDLANIGSIKDLRYEEADFNSKAISEHDYLLFLDQEGVNHSNYSLLIDDPRNTSARLWRSIPTILLNSTFDIADPLNLLQFQEHQEYWIGMNSETRSCPRVVGVPNYPDCTFDNLKVTKSLPNVSHLHGVNHKEDNPICDSEECHRNYWKTLSSENLCELTDFYSDYHDGLPKSSSHSKVGKKVSHLFKKKLQFWENLSLDSLKSFQGQSIRKDRTTEPLLSDRKPSGITPTNRATFLSRKNEENAILRQKSEVNKIGDLKEKNQRQYFKNLKKLVLRIANRFCFC